MEPESTEPAPASDKFSQTAQSIVSLVANAFTDLEHSPSSYSQDESAAVNTTVDTYTPSNSSPAIPAAARVIQHVVAGAATIAEKVLYPDHHWQQQSLLVGEDAQVAIDALHDVSYHILKPIIASS